MQDSTQERVRALIDHAGALHKQMMHPDPDREWLLSVAWIRFYADQILQNEKVKVLTVHVSRMSAACQPHVESCQLLRHLNEPDVTLI